MVSRGSTHGRIKVYYRGLDVENPIKSEIEEQKGRSVISRKSRYGMDCLCHSTNTRGLILN
jgi:hypothetical protein